MNQSSGQVATAPRGGEAGGLRWLNSLRALGVTLVLVYHFFPSFLPGGFIGVDVFFVVSGYLITSLLVREFERSGGLRMFDFFRRRWLRLFPAIVAMLLVSLPLSLLIPSDFRTDIARQTAAALSWTTNYYEIFTGQSYESQLLPHLFIHTWTLSVEMHYYLVWGAVTAFVIFIVRRAGRQGGVAVRVAMMSVAAAFAVVSFFCMRSGAARASDPSVAYMSTLSHIFPLMIGSAFGCLYGFSPLVPSRKTASARIAPSETQGLPVKNTAVAARIFKPASLIAVTTRIFKPASLIAIAAGLASIVVLSFEFSFRDPRVYQYGILAVSLITAAILCLARTWQDLSPRREPGVTNYIGLRSYSIYLFHWPIMIVAGRLAERLGMAPDAASAWSAAVGIPATFLVAELSYRWVEQPFRARRRSAYATGLAHVADSAYATGLAHAADFVYAAGSVHAADSVYATGSVGTRVGEGDRRRNVASACVAAVLIAISLNAVTTAPRISDIESGLRYGAMSLDVSNLKGLYGDVIEKEKYATRNEGEKLRENGGDG